MVKNKKGVELTLQTIIIFIILLIVLIILMIFFITHYGGTWTQISNTSTSVISDFS